MNEINNKFPSCFFDNETIREKRSKAQKKYKNADYFTYFTYRKVSIYISDLFLKIGVSALSVTFLSLFIFLLSISCVLFFPKSISIYCVPILWHLGYFFDVIDGEIARMQDKTSSLGAILDKYIFLFCVISYYTYTSLFFNIGIEFLVLIICLCSFDIFFNVSNFKVKTMYSKKISYLQAILSLVFKLPFIKPGSILLIPIIYYFFEIKILAFFILFILFINFFWSLKKFYTIAIQENFENE